MSRANNGVRSKVTNDAQRRSEDEGNGMGGTMREGSAANDMSAPVKMRDCEAITGSKGSRGTEKGMGGIEIKGDEEHRDFFKDEH